MVVRRGLHGVMTRQRSKLVYLLSRGREPKPSRGFVFSDSKALPHKEARPACTPLTPDEGAWNRGDLTLDYYRRYVRGSLPRRARSQRPPCLPPWGTPTDTAGGNLSPKPRRPPQ